MFPGLSNMLNTNKGYLGIAVDPTARERETGFGVLLQARAAMLQAGIVKRGFG
jgi:hypothetical protein